MLPPPSPPEEQTPTREPVLVRLADVEPEEVCWLWEPYIARGKLTNLEGDPGVGKSWLALTLAAIVSKGWPFPGPDGIPRQEQVREPANVLYLSAEDGVADTIRVRLDAAGADVGRVYVLTGWTAQTESGDKLDGYVTLQDITLLEEALARVRPTLLVVDPVQGFLGGVDAWRAEQVRPILSHLGELAARHGCAVLLIRHLSKSAKDKAVYRGLGSIDFAAAARSVLAVVRKDEDRGVVHIKSSLAPEGPSIGFDIREGRFVWTGPSKLTKVDVNAPEAPPEDRTQAEECADFLREMLADGPRPAQELIRAAKRLGHSERTIDNAKVLAGVKARSKRGLDGKVEGWEWFLPDRTPDPHQSTTPPPKNRCALVTGTASPSAPTIPPDNHQSAEDTPWRETGETIGPQGFQGQSTRAHRNIGEPPDALGGVVEEGLIE
ncbi:MAG TPA: AAA family ATPase, partial [Firmicutes bacterium]|nr:AAA family ATPase [Bacillota bacterium]